MEAAAYTALVVPRRPGEPVSKEAVLSALLATADDDRVSRKERKALRADATVQDLSAADRAWLRQRVVGAVLAQATTETDRDRLEWLADAIRVLEPQDDKAPHPPSRAWFGPEDPMVESLLAFLQGARTSLDCCVFTITDDRVTAALLDAARRGVTVRIVSDNDKAWDLGSDIERLERRGVAVRVDRSPHHMHHKFAVADRARLLNGSYNWTRSADSKNRENLCVSYEPGLVAAFSRAFEALWADLASL